MAYILNRYNPSEFPGPTIRKAPYYDLGPSTWIPNAPSFPAPFQSKWHADVSGLGDWRFPWTWGWLKNAFKGGSTFSGSTTLQMKDGRNITGNFIESGDQWFDSITGIMYPKSNVLGTLGSGFRTGQGWLAKIFGSIGGGLESLFAKLKQGGSGTETPGGGGSGGGGTGTGTGTNQPKTIAGLDPNILLVIGALAIGGIFLIMSRPTQSGQPQIIMPEMFRPRKTYARRRAAPARRTTVKRRRR